MDILIVTLLFGLLSGCLIGILITAMFFMRRRAKYIDLVSKK